MSNHIVDLLGDYLAGRLDAPARVALEQHVTECRECAADLAFARALRDQGNAGWAGHLASDRIVVLASGEGVATAEEEAHLKICNDCDGELAWVRATPTTPEEESTSTTGRRDHRKRISWAVGAVAVAAVVAAFLFMPRSPDREQLRLLAQVEPLPVHLVRGGEPADDLTSRRLRGLEAYRDGEFPAAVTALRPVAAAGDLEANLYLGSALNLLGRPAEATAPLNAVVAAASSPELVDLALWQLANAHLAGGNPRLARDVLVRLRDLGGAHAAPAAKLLAAFD